MPMESNLHTKDTIYYYNVYILLNNVYALYDHTAGLLFYIHYLLSNFYIMEFNLKFIYSFHIYNYAL